MEVKCCVNCGDVPKKLHEMCKRDHLYCAICIKKHVITNNLVCKCGEEWRMLPSWQLCQELDMAKQRSEEREEQALQELQKMTKKYEELVKEHYSLQQALEHNRELGNSLFNHIHDVWGILHDSPPL